MQKTQKLLKKLHYLKYLKLNANIKVDIILPRTQNIKSKLISQVAALGYKKSFAFYKVYVNAHNDSVTI